MASVTFEVKFEAKKETEAVINNLAPFFIIYDIKYT